MRCASATCSVDACSSDPFALARRRVGNTCRRWTGSGRPPSVPRRRRPRRTCPVAFRDAWAGSDRLADEVGGLVGEMWESCRRSWSADHRRAHERHVNRGEVDVVADRLRADDAVQASSAALDATYAENGAVGLHADRRDVDDVAGVAIAHVGQKAHDQLDRAEIVELDRALEVVKAVIGERHRATDRAAGVVDQDIDAGWSASTCLTSSSTESGSETSAV